MKNIKKLLLSIVVLPFVAVGVIFFLQPAMLAEVGQSVVSVFRHYPAETGAKTITLNCDYHGKNLSINEVVYSSVNDYYKSDLKKNIAYLANDNLSFVYTDKEDDTIKKLSDDIRAVGKAEDLDEDETLDLAACFLQSIPYDEAKAVKILSTDKQYPISEVVPRYPYETLYDFTGICTDKSFLGVAVFRELGYESALLSFEKERHMSIGLGVPNGYQELGTADYAIIELTATGFKVGDIPDLKKNIGQAENTIKNIPEISKDSVETRVQEQKITTASKVEKVSDGKEYRRIIERTKLRAQIEDMNFQLNASYSSFESAKRELEQAEKTLEEYEKRYMTTGTSSSYNEYMRVYNSYLAIYNSTSVKVNDYNQLVKSYNTLVQDYKNNY